MAFLSLSFVTTPRGRTPTSTGPRTPSDLDYDVPVPRRHVTKPTYARAIYDNIAESPDELAFKRGDILTVIEQDTDGLTGWWLCKLRGRQGICPGNRLRIVQSYDSGCCSPSPISSPCPSIGSSSSLYANHTTHVSNPSELYENTSVARLQKHGKRRSWHIMPNKVVTPQKCGDVYLYDLLPTPQRGSGFLGGTTVMSGDTSETYDVPKPAVPVNYDVPRVWHSPRGRPEDCCYDIPRPVTLLSQKDLTPSSSNSSLLTSDSLSLSSSNRSSLANMTDYDVPRRVARASPHPSSMSTSTASLQLNYDVPIPHSPQNHTLQLSTCKELPLELGSALDTLAKLQTEATNAVTRLLAFVSPQWRTKEKLDPILMDLKLAAVRLRTALHDLAEFGEGALGNTAKADDKGLSIKLRPLVRALKDADRLVHEASHCIDIQGWTLETLTRAEIKAGTQLPPDSLDQLIACAQTLTEDVRQTASFIQGNATLLFKRISPSVTPQTPSNNNNGDWPEDYDYVCLESKEASARKNAEIRDALPSDLQKNFENVVKNAESAAIGATAGTELDPNDKTLLVYYAAQTVTHMNYLTQAIDAFLQTVEHNQPPKFFLAHGKFVVLSAHNLVNIGDIVHRNVTKQDVRGNILQCADALSDGMKACVAKTKKAAQHFPSVNAVQEMVDSVVDISHLASDLKIAMLRAVQQ
ncbi:breast cancer anti-estrogen resistance protein 1 isoform X1 [Lutzomyia longipalpis]|uniref:breast cancer anti-estrogen resistance protein 1 isoform X1 n=1 Tax=Lutzomyia longipalpis TaxID=7200 RepID=UPI00248388C2|nr:breast cancer anti-estrogen resistance protein 1 isoform X1 [Lutzomyia longipalpis]